MADDTIVDSQVTQIQGAVSCGSDLCSKAGARILKAGGNAIDATITTQLCLGVVNAHASGIGGETAPQAASCKMFMEDESLAQIGGLAVAVPGEIRGFWEAWQRYGKLPWKQLFVPAIDLARNGFEITGHLVESMNKVKDTTLAYSSKLRNIYMPGGVPVREGDVLKRPDLADTLEIIATEGVDAFYNGRLSQNIVNAVQQSGGIMTREDLAGYRAIWREPLRMTYLDRTVYTAPAPSSGPTFMFIMGLLEGYDLKLSEMDDPVIWHRLTETFKHALAHQTQLGDLDYVGDVEETTKTMMNKSYLEKVRQGITDDTTHAPEHYGPASDKSVHGTANSCVRDSDGNAVVATSSLNWYFGSGVTTDGIVFNEHMEDFCWPTITDDNQDRKANFIEPGKRPLSGICPVIAHKTSNNSDTLIIGGIGGKSIVTGVSQVFLNLTSYGLSLEEAVRRGRLHELSKPRNVLYEERIPKEIIDALEARGHDMIRRQTSIDKIFVIAVEDGKLSAIADQRKKGSGVQYIYA
ncbi:glutathione hydrolase 1 proenzyme-like isoform X3 [Ptychodera flava]|uniref:glutathione hydrolase 1 proenzyme-like isoform X3 n=1 Tax=Ptychodera flava TaxID=63121 RepID=UPI003969C952